MVAQAMIEEIALPIDTMFSSDELFPVLDGCCHSWFAGECHYRVQMIRHKQTQAAMPDESLVIKFHGLEHGVASLYAAQLVFAWWHAIDGDKEPTPLGDPLWNYVRQLFTDREIHI